MTPQILEILIRAACSNGSVNEEERLFLIEQARLINLTEESLNFLILSELGRVKEAHQLKINTDQNNASGFITSDNSHSANASGFISENEQFQNFSIRNGQFTEISDLPTQGAMSLIQKGKYLGKWVIIKRLKPENRTSPKYIELLYKEFENAYYLDHPNIVRIISKGEDSEGPFYFMEYIDGRALTKLLTKVGLEKGELIKKIVIEVLHALDYVHKQQLYHRDLKPDNILITYKGDNVKLIDFGLAQADVFEDKLIKVGTPRYASPEQKNKGYAVDGRSDIYSFGLILLEMLTGQIDDVEKAKLRSVQLYALIKKCLATEPAGRYSYCSEIVEVVRTSAIKDIDLKNVSNSTSKQDISHSLSSKTYLTFKDFAVYSYNQWKNGFLKDLESSISLDYNFTSKAQNILSYNFAVENFKNYLCISLFSTYFFLPGEYFIRSDKRQFFLTNYRLFLYQEFSQKFEIISFAQSEIKPEMGSNIDRIYVVFNNHKIWKSDWELILRTYNKKDFTKLEAHYLPLLLSSKPEAMQHGFYSQSELDEINGDLVKIVHTGFDDFINFTKFTYSADKIATYYNRRFLDHSNAIKSLIPFVRETMKEYMPFENEFFFLNSFHDGIITNFRIFYKSQKRVQVVPLNNVDLYSKAKKFFNKEIEITLKSGSPVVLPLVGMISKDETNLVRINQMILLEDWKNIAYYDLPFLENDNSQMDQYWRTT